MTIAQRFGRLFEAPAPACWVWRFQRPSNETDRIFESFHVRYRQSQHCAGDEADRFLRHLVSDHACR